MFQFEYPIWWWALLAVPLLGILFGAVIRWKRKTLKKIGDPELVQSLIRGHSPKKFLWSHIALTFALVAMVVALAHLRKPSEGNNITRNGVDVMIALDVSKSMLAEDLPPNRMERARHFASRFLDELANDRVGLVLFAGKAYFQMPLTADIAAANLYVNAAGPSMVPTQGTVIGEALRLSNSAFNQKEKKYKAVILITDGEDHDPDALATAKALAEKGVMICTVGLGSPAGSRIPDPETGGWKKDVEGNIVNSALNEGLLREIAATANGQYVHLLNTDAAVQELKEKLDGMEKRTVADSSQTSWASYAYWFILAALLLLLGEFLLNTWPARFKKKLIFFSSKKRV